MKKIAVIFVLIFLSGCTFMPDDNNIIMHDNLPSETISSETYSEVLKNTDSIKPIVVYRNTDNFTGYLVGGLVNGKIVNLQDNDNYKLFDLTGKENYMFFSNKGEPTPISSESFEINYISSNGTYEIEVFFNDAGKKLDSDYRYIGIGNYSKILIKKNK